MKTIKDIAMIAAVGPDLELGSHGDLIWHISADLKNFKRLTTGHPVVMGRKTWESLPKRPLPGRLNIVMTRRNAPVEGAATATSVEEVLELCKGQESPFIIGGQQIYQLFMPFASHLYLTHVDAEPAVEVDAWFPDYHGNWKLDEASEWVQYADAGVRYRFERWSRI